MIQILEKKTNCEKHDKYNINTKENINVKIQIFTRDFNFKK